METLNWLYLKNVLTNGSASDIHEALVVIKDSIIGSNKQKSELISIGILPILIRICSQHVDISNKVEAFIILASLAKGTNSHVDVLIENFSVVTLLKNELAVNNIKYCSEICLGALCSILRNSPMSMESFFDESCSLPLLLDLTSSINSLKTQIYVSTILYLLCLSRRDQDDMLNAGVVNNLTRLMLVKNEQLQLSVLRCLCRMCYENRSVSDNICVTSFRGKSMLDILVSLLSRSCSPQIQLNAAKCLTYIYRSGTLMSSDPRILHKTLPCLVRLCSENFDSLTRSTAAEELSFLIQTDAELQKTASICNHLLKSLYQLLRINSSDIKKSVLKCYAALASNDETIRKKIMETNNLIDEILNGLDDWEMQVRVASAQCLHALSRSVQQLRTTFQDHSVWESLLSILNNETSQDLLNIVTATICNLLLEFSPSKTHILGRGIIERLSVLVDTDEPNLKLNCTWALMNLVYQSEDEIKSNVINIFGINRICRILIESKNTLVITKALGLLRNLLSNSHHINIILKSHHTELIDALDVLLDSSNSTTIKEQILCILGNMTIESEKDEYITLNIKIMKIVFKLMNDPETRLQVAALYVINNTVQNNELWKKKKSTLTSDQQNILKGIEDLRKSIHNAESNDIISKTIKQIILKLNKMYPEIFR